jgi:hypothetical protein
MKRAFVQLRRRVVDAYDFVRYDIPYGFGNLIEWLPIIWRDRDYDSAYLLRVMEFKFSRMAEVFDNGHHVGHERDARRVRVCAAICRRMIDDDYAENQGVNGTAFDDGIWRRYDRAERQHDQDLAYMTLLLRKYLRGWWD